MANRTSTLSGLATMAVLALLAGCGSHATTPAPAALTSPSGAPQAAAPALPVPSPMASASASAVPETPLAAKLERQQWSQADNWADCAPIAFTSDGGAPGTAHARSPAGGWGIAFDRPGLRDAYGITGPAPLPSDTDDAELQVNRMLDQWPYFKRLPQLPQPAFAGYGPAGGETYPAANPDGKGMRSLAAVRIGGQQCTYQVWSMLGRAHLESLLASLQMLQIDSELPDRR